PNEPMKVIRNRVVEAWAGKDNQTPPPPDPPEFIGNTLLGGQPYQMPKFSAALPTPETSGAFEEMCLAAGESAGLTNQIRSVQEIINEMMDQAEMVIEGRLGRLSKGRTSTAP